MTIQEVELRVQRSLSQTFINADFRDISLTRRTAIPDGAGGMVAGSPVSLPLQRFRLLPQEDGATARTTADGETATPEYILMGSYDCDMERFDEFLIGDRRFQIIYIDDRQYEIKGEAIYLGV